MAELKDEKIIGVMYKTDDSTVLGGPVLFGVTDERVYMSDNSTLKKFIETYCTWHDEPTD